MSIEEIFGSESLFVSAIVDDVHDEFVKTEQYQAYIDFCDYLHKEICVTEDVYGMFVSCCAALQSYFSSQAYRYGLYDGIYLSKSSFEHNNPKPIKQYCR